MEKLNRLLATLLSQTEKGLIDWRATAEPESFQFSMPDNTVCIEHDGVSDTYFLSIMNGTGETVDRVAGDDLGGPGARHTMEQLYKAARRRALKAEETLDGILARLEAKV